jgi:hypothetical protein
MSLTGEDIRRLEEEQAKISKKLVVVDTMQFFEIEIPADLDAEFYVDSEACRKICADKILSQMTDLKLDRTMKWDAEKEKWID